MFPQQIFFKPAHLKTFLFLPQQCNSYEGEKFYALLGFIYTAI